MNYRPMLTRLFFTHLLLLELGFAAMAQVPLRPVAEHFTNTKCSICASKNPALYSNLSANPNMMHLSIHPSSPYPSCILSQQNTADNDARTNFYDIYGGTPKLVLNGILHQGTNFSSPTLFDPYENLTTPFDVRMEQTKSNGNMVWTKIVVKTVADHALSEALLFAGLAEDTVFVNGGNGEPTHPNVLRRALTSPSGLLIDLPALPGDSSVFEFSADANAVWDFDRIFSVAILQDATTKQVLQTAKTGIGSSGGGTTSTQEAEQRGKFVLYPNPANELLTIENLGQEDFLLEIIAVDGRAVHRSTNPSKVLIGTASLQNGTYLVRLSAGNATTHQVLVIQH